MYHRSDEGAYYRKVLVPLERNTHRRRRRMNARRRLKKHFANVWPAIRKGQFARGIRAVMKALKKEFAPSKDAREETGDGIGLSDGSLCFSDERIAVYTAVFGGYDRLQEPLFCPDNVDYFVFTDGQIPAGSRWTRLPWEGKADPALTDAGKNRYLKMFPNLLFPEYAYSVYVDGNILVTADLTALAMRARGFPVALHMHKDRDCVYEEIDACIAKGKDTPEALNAQRAALREMGIPEHWGLLEAPVIARRHHDPLCIRIMESWWDCFCAGSKRDQIALISCLWELGIQPRQLGALGENLLKSSQFIWCPHEKTKN